MRILLAFLLFSSIAISQDTGTISGKLVDTSSAIIPSAFVSILMSNNGFEGEEIVSSKTDRNGNFLFGEMPVGKYFISIDLKEEYYSDQMRFEIVIESNKTINFDDLIYSPNIMCICELKIVPYVEPRDPFGRSVTFTREEIRRN